MSSTILKPTTADELLAMPEDGFCYELIRGELITMTPPGAEHGFITMRVAGPLHQYVREHDLGVVFAAETGFKLSSDPDTVRAADVAFISKSRSTRVKEVRGYWDGPPDLAVEVLSPNDRARQISEKTGAWLNAGARCVWIVNPRNRTIALHDNSGVKTLSGSDTLMGDDLIPGFELPLDEIFVSKSTR